MNKYTCKSLWENYELLANNKEKILIKGHCRTLRTSKKLIFIEINDGTSFNNVHLVIFRTNNDLKISQLGINTPLMIEGIVKTTPDREQSFEIHVIKIQCLNFVIDDYPLQKKEQTLEYLRTKQEYRLSTSIMTYTQRVREAIISLLMEYLKKNDYMWIQTPTITTNNTEGGGDVFDLQTESEFFSKQTYLTVSGQLCAEIAAQSFHKVYTMGPTFRAEKSDTPFHAAEFWMLEPEITYYDLNDIIEEAKNALNYVAHILLKKYKKLIIKLEKFYQVNLQVRLEQIEAKDYQEIEYSNAQELLKQAPKENFKFRKFNFGDALQREHEQYLCNYFVKPIIIKNFPLATSPFYMYDTGNKTSASFDFIVPAVGEIIGGSQREHRYQFLEKQLLKKANKETLKWYLDMRKKGYAPSSGYGLGIDRLVMYFTGTKNIKDVQLFPRAYKHIYF